MSSQQEQKSSPEHELLSGLFAHFHRTPEDMARFSTVLCWWANGGRWPSNGLESNDASEYAFECSLYWALTPDQRESVHRIVYEMEGRQEGTPEKEPNTVLREVMREFLAVSVPPVQKAGEDQEFVRAIDQMLAYAVPLADMPRGQTPASTYYLVALESWRSTHPEPHPAENPVKGGYGISRAHPRTVFFEGNEIYPYGRPATLADIQKGHISSQTPSPASSTPSIDIEQLIREMKDRVAAIEREKESTASKNGALAADEAAKISVDSNPETTSKEGSTSKRSAPEVNVNFLAGDTPKPVSKSGRRAASEKNSKRKRADLLSEDDDDKVTKMRKQTRRQRPADFSVDTSNNSARRSSNRVCKSKEPRAPILFDDTSSESEIQEILGVESGDPNRRLLRQLPLRASPNPQARPLPVGSTSDLTEASGGVAPSSSMAEQRDLIVALPSTIVPAPSAQVFKLTKKWREPENQPLQTASTEAKAFFEKTKNNRRTEEAILRRADSNVDWTQSRKNNYKILLVHLAGRLAPIPCLSCKYGRGPYADCVIFDDLREGKCCTNCLHNDEFNCSFEKGGILTTFAYGKLRKEGKLAAVANGDYDPENPTLSMRKVPRPHLKAARQTPTTQTD